MTPGVADVDHVRVAVVVLGHAKAGAERRHGEQQPDGPDACAAALRVR